MNECDIGLKISVTHYVMGGELPREKDVDVMDAKKATRHSTIVVTLQAF